MTKAQWGRKIYLSAQLIVCALVFLSACGTKELPTAEKTLFEPLAENTQNAPPSKQTENEDEPASEGIVVHSASEYLLMSDDIYLPDKENYCGTPAILAYDDYLSTEIPRRYEEWDYPIHIAMGLVDGDNIPELFIGQGDNTPSGVMICQYDPDNCTVRSLGTFSQFGFCRYAEQKNRIWSQYGNQGLYDIFFSKIENDHVELVGVLTEDGSADDLENGIVYYANFPVPKGLDGSHESGCEMNAIPGLDDTYIVSSEAYNALWNEYFNTQPGDRVVEMRYDQMTPISTVSTQSPAS